jgi:hypothetical protein
MIFFPINTLGMKDAVWVDLIQHQERLLGFIAQPFELLFIEIFAGYAVFVGDEAVLVIEFGNAGIDNHRIVMDADKVVIAPLLQSVRITPSNCQGVLEQAGYQVCQDILILMPVVTSFGRAAATPAISIKRSISSRTVSGCVFNTATLPLPGKSVILCLLMNPVMRFHFTR